MNMVDRIPGLELVPLRDDFEYRTQRRKAQATSTWNQSQVAGADFETKDGYPHIFTWTIYEGNEYVDRHFLFGGTTEEPEMFLEANGGKEHPAFDLKTFCQLHFLTGSFSQGGHGKRRKPQEMWYFNLQYDAQAIIKSLPSATVDSIYSDMTVIVDTETWNVEPDARRLKVPNPNYGKIKRSKRSSTKRKKKPKKDMRKTIQVWAIGTEEDYVIMPFNRYIKVSYLPKKHLSLEPIKFYTDGVKWAKIDCWDIRPFCGGGSLNVNAKKHLNETKIDFSKEEMKLLGSLSPEGIKFSIDNKEKILKYAEKDANLTARLAWKIVSGFESNGVRMSRPYSCASVAERAALDRCDIPTLNDLINTNRDDVLASWSSYTGGWFESVGSGYWPDVKCFDITSAYPHVMWWLPDFTHGDWMGSFNGDPDEEAWDYLKRHWKPYSLSYFECEVVFPEGMNIYPAAKKAENAMCLMNPRTQYGWFTGDEVNEFLNWNAEIEIERWSAFIPIGDLENAIDVQDGIRYPFRPFIEQFYGGKLEQDMLKGTSEYDPEKRAIFKLMINSLYGKTVQAIESEDLRRTGGLWNPFYGAVITAGCRARMAEMIRLNGDDNVLAVNTDGLIFKADADIVVPENPKPVMFDDELVNLGDWDEDGEGSLLLMMSGVYSVLKDILEGIVVDSKTTFRGSYAMFIDHRDDENNLITDFYAEDWFSFCKRYEDESEVVRNAEINPTMRPYSLGEAKMRSNYALTNVFRIVELSITAHGDSNKRRWEETPKTFGDLTERWWPSSAWERSI